MSLLLHKKLLGLILGGYIYRYNPSLRPWPPYSVNQKIPHKFSNIFSKRLGIFSPNFNAY